ncbi:MAG: HAMP domain-containing sensor histidine kinase [Polyangiales bacterium]
MSVRTRMLGAVTGLTVLTLGVAFASVSVVVNRGQERRLDRALLRAARAEAREIAALGGDRLAISDLPGPRANDVGPLPKYAAVYGPDGAVRVATDTFRGRPPPWRAVGHPAGAAFDLAGPGEHLRGVVVALPAPPGARLLLAAPRTDLDGDAAFLRRAMELVFLAAVAWSVALASWFVRRITRGYDRVAEVVGRAAGGDLSARVLTRSPDRDLARLERDLDGMIGQLAALVDAQRRFIANAAHELRSPLTVLLGEITLTLRKERSAPEYRTALEEALTSTERLRALADELLALARLGADAGAPAERVELAALVRSALDELAVQAEARGVALVGDGAEASVDGRSTDLQRMVRNLVENAVRHAGGRVRVATAARGGRAEIVVEDDGPGVPEADRARIFEPFYRGPRERAAGGGAGLGLAIAREIARDHGGDLALDRSERGARFVVTFPRPSQTSKR